MNNVHEWSSTPFHCYSAQVCATQKKCEITNMWQQHKWYMQQHGTFAQKSPTTSNMSEEYRKFFERIWQEAGIDTMVTTTTHFSPRHMFGLRGFDVASTQKEINTSLADLSHIPLFKRSLPLRKLTCVSAFAHWKLATHISVPCALWESALCLCLCLFPVDSTLAPPVPLGSILLFR